MELVDAQLHVWAPDSPEHPWAPGGGSPTRQVSDIEYDAMLTTMDAAGVGAGILVSAGLYGWDNSYALEAADRHPDRFRVVGRIDPWDPAVADNVAAFAEHPLAVGIRFMVRGEELSRLSEGGYDPVIEAAGKAGLSVGLLGPEATRDFGALFARHAEVQFLIDHFGVAAPPPRGQGIDHFRDFDDVLTLAEHPNAAIKLSGGPALSETDFPYEQLQPRILQLLDAYGVDRLVWGSDWTRVPNATYEQGVRYLEDWDGIDAADKARIMGANARRIFGWPGAA